MRRGRPPEGPALVARLDVPSVAKQRFQVVLETLCGEKTTPQASQELGLSLAGFHKLRRRWLMLAALLFLPRPNGRPRRQETVSLPYVRELEGRNEQLELQLKASRAEADLARHLPRLQPGARGGSRHGRQQKQAAGSLPNRRGRSAGRGRRRDAAKPLAEPPPRQSAAAQAPRRAQERTARKRAVAFLRWAQRRGKSLAEAAKILGVSVTTAWRWHRQWRQGHLSATRLGRPVGRPSPKRRNRVVRKIVEVGPNLGLAVLQTLFPGFPRRELADLKRRLMALWAYWRRYHWLQVRWTRPGAVWAVDLATPPFPIQGENRQILAIRDLASHYQLAWEPVADATAAANLAVWWRIGEEEGFPLVRKNDNGSTFQPWERTLAGVTPPTQVLWSPPRQPRYNGAIEAAVHSMKDRTETMAALAGHPGIWTPEDCAAARQQANQLARPWGARGPTPEEVWRSRTPLSPGERGDFTNLFASVYKEVAGCPRIVEDRRLDRQVLRLTLERSGLLEFRRRRFPLLLSRLFLPEDP